MLRGKEQAGREAGTRAELLSPLHVIVLDLTESLRQPTESSYVQNMFHTCRLLSALSQLETRLGILSDSM